MIYSYPQEKTFKILMKRNKHIDKQVGKTFSWGIVALVFVIPLLGIQAYSIFKLGYSNIAICFSVILAMIVGKLLQSQVESILLQRMKTSIDFEKLTKSFEFNETDTNYYEVKFEGYFITMYNHVNPKIKSDGRVNSFCLELFCDCSELSTNEINEIEDSGFVVTHHSIRKFSSNWFIRFNANKISNMLNQQLELVYKYQLKNIDEEELKKKEYWI